MEGNLKKNNEMSRLEALKAYRILDSESEERFNSLLHLASHICGTPIALVSLIDAERQWFKAKLGVEVAETPLDQSFCIHAINSGEGLYVVDNASTHPLFKDNPLVTSDPNIEFYAGAPLITPDNVSVGTLCVIDSVPHSLTTIQKEALQILARQVVYLLELRKNTAELIEKLDALKILEGQWTVCMYCRRIKDDVGKWSQLESYIRTKTHAEFSHGVCPDCYSAKVQG